jgi:ATP-dependent DNA ligase
LLHTTERYPDAVEYLSEALQPGVKSFIIDAEIVGVVSTDESECVYQLLPFQDLSTRRGTKQDNPHLCIRFAILNGVSLIKQPLYERQRTLGQHFKKTAGFAFVSSTTLARYDAALIQNFLKEAMHGGAEGLMIKLTGREEKAGSDLSTSRKMSGYEYDARGQLWLS